MIILEISHNFVENDNGDSDMYGDMHTDRLRETSLKTANTAILPLRSIASQGGLLLELRARKRCRSPHKSPSASATITSGDA